MLYPNRLDYGDSLQVRNVVLVCLPFTKVGYSDVIIYSSVQRRLESGHMILTFACLRT